MLRTKIIEDEDPWTLLLLIKLIEEDINVLLMLLGVRNGRCHVLLVVPKGHHLVLQFIVSSVAWAFPHGSLELLLLLLLRLRKGCICRVSSLFHV